MLLQLPVLADLWLKLIGSIYDRMVLYWLRQINSGIAVMTAS